CCPALLLPQKTGRAQSAGLLDPLPLAIRTAFRHWQNPPGENKSRPVSCEPKARARTCHVAERISWPARSPLSHDQASRLPARLRDNRRVPARRCSVLNPSREPDFCAPLRFAVDWRERPARPMPPTLPGRAHFSEIHAESSSTSRPPADRFSLLQSAPPPTEDLPAIFGRSSWFQVVPRWRRTGFHLLFAARRGPR